jgi:hypothetical protein
MHVLMAITVQGADAASPAELFATLVRERIKPIAPHEMVRVLLELWGVFDLLKAIRITDQNGGALAQELSEPLVAVAGLLYGSIRECESSVRCQLLAIVREILSACEEIFEHVSGNHGGDLEMILLLMERSILSESPAIFDNA